eukprot:3409984-Pyramimonas_sp.AAC.1
MAHAAGQNALTVSQMQSSSRLGNFSSSSTSHAFGFLWKRRDIQHAADSLGRIHEHPHTSSTSRCVWWWPSFCAGRLSRSHCAIHNGAARPRASAA